MSRKPSSTWTAIGVALIVLLLLAGAYVGAYLALSETVISTGRVRTRLRDFRYQYLATAFQPCAWVESVATGENVETSCTADFWEAIKTSR